MGILCLCLLVLGVGGLGVGFRGCVMCFCGVLSIWWGAGSRLLVICFCGGGCGGVFLSWLGCF